MSADHKELRDELVHAKEVRASSVRVSCVDLAELLAAYDALVAAGAKPKKATGYSAEFEEAWAEYPKRGNHSKAAAFKCWNTRLKEGASMESMVEGMRRFAAVMVAEARPSKMVMHAATFFGPDKRYEDEWIVPRAEVRRALPDRRTTPPEAPEEAEARRKRWGITPSAVGDGDAPY